MWICIRNGKWYFSAISKIKNSSLLWWTQWRKLWLTQQLDILLTNDIIAMLEMVSFDSYRGLIRLKTVSVLVIIQMAVRHMCCYWLHVCVPFITQALFLGQLDYNNLDHPLEKWFVQFSVHLTEFYSVITVILRQKTCYEFMRNINWMVIGLCLKGENWSSCSTNTRHAD